MTTATHTYTVRLFALAKDLAGAAAIEVELPPSASFGELRAQLLRQCPALGRLDRHLLFAQNNEYQSDIALIGPQREIACIPPVSGG